MTNRTRFILSLFLGVLLPITWSASYAQELVRNTNFAYKGDTPGLSNSLESIPLKEAINLLKKHYKIRVAYRQGLLAGKEASVAMITESFRRDAETALNSLLTENNLSFKKIGGNQFSLFAVEPSPPAQTASVVYPIRGKVISADGTGLPSVTVILKGKPELATVTDTNGNFRFNLPDDVKNDQVVLVFSSVGYLSKEVRLNENQTQVPVSLEPESKSLNEVVVTALGIRRTSKSLTYSVTEVKGEEFTQARENNVANALTGKDSRRKCYGFINRPGWFKPGNDQGKWFNYR